MLWRFPGCQSTAAASQDALCTILVAASLLSSPPALAAQPPTINDAIVEVSQTSYPIIKALRVETFVPFTEKLGDLLLGLPQEQIGTTIALGIDVLNSVPDETLSIFQAAVKDGLGNLKTDSCTLAPLPSATSAKAFVAIANSNVDSAKLREFRAKWGPVVEALPTTVSAICLPPVETLDKLALAQAEVGRSFGSEESRRFNSYAAPFLAVSISPNDALPLLADAKKLAPTATGAEKTAFRFAGMKIEAITKQEKQAQERAERDAASREALSQRMARDRENDARRAAARAAVTGSAS